MKKIFIFSIFFLLPSCNKEYISRDIKIVHLHGDNKAILKRDKDGYFGEFLVLDNVKSYCKKGAFVFGYRDIPQIISNENSSFSDLKEIYEKDIGGFVVNIKKKTVTYIPSMTENEVDKICS